MSTEIKRNYRGSDTEALTAIAALCGQPSTTRQNFNQTILYNSTSIAIITALILPASTQAAI